MAWDGALEGINRQNQYAERSNLSQLQAMSALQGIGKSAADTEAANANRQREAQFRAKLSELGANPSHEQVVALAAASGLIPAKDMMTVMQGAESKRLQTEATREMARGRLQQAAAIHDQDYQIKLRQATTAAGRAAVDAWDKQVRAQIARNTYA